MIALDGKTLRGAWRKDSSEALHVVSAFDVGKGIALYQDGSNSKGSEQAVVRRVIDALALEDAIVTLDALHCQTQTMTKVKKHKKSDFVIQLKSNQPTLYEAVKACFTEHYDAPALATFTQCNQGHGRKEQRTVMQLSADQLPDTLQKKWPHIHSLIEVASERQMGEVKSCCSRSYVSSLPIDAEAVAGIVREHWTVENNLHWVLDVVFREDELKVSDPAGAKHLTLFNRAALGILKQHQGKKDSLAAKRRAAGWSGEFRTKLLFG